MIQRAERPLLTLVGNNWTRNNFLEASVATRMIIWWREFCRKRVTNHFSLGAIDLFSERGSCAEMDRQRVNYGRDHGSWPVYSVEFGTSSPASTGSSKRAEKIEAGCWKAFGKVEGEKREEPVKPEKFSPRARLLNLSLSLSLCGKISSTRYDRLCSRRRLKVLLKLDARLIFFNFEHLADLNGEGFHPVIYQ